MAPPKQLQPGEETPRHILFALCWRGGDGALEKVRDLIETKQVKVNDVDENNVTALRFAAQYNHEDILRYLLSKGASPKIRAEDGRDPLFSAVEKRNIEIVQILLEHGANPSSRCGETCPLVQARDNLHPEMVDLLLRYGAREVKPFSQTIKEKCVLL